MSVCVDVRTCVDGSSVAMSDEVSSSLKRAVSKGHVWGLSDQRQPIPDERLPQKRLFVENLFSCSSIPV